MRVKNFGENVVYEPQHFYTPKTEGEVLEILTKHKDGQVRVQSSGHSWSDVVKADDAYINLKYFKAIVIEETSSGPVAKIGAGATLEYILRILEKTSDYTLPTLGGIKEQTISGATATATHGTGKTSLSNYIRAVKLASYDSFGNPQIKIISEGDELLAVRCSLGCMGVILEMTIQIVPRFWMQERLVKYKNIHEILSKEDEWPQQQFMVLPHSWIWYAYHRKEMAEPNSRTKRKMRFFKIYDYLFVELGLHVLVKIIKWEAIILGNWIIVLFWKYVVPVAMRPHSLVGDSETILTLHTEHHHNFRHVEMELFIQKEHLPAVANFTQEAISFFSGKTNKISDEIKKKLEEAGLYSSFQKLHNTYTHHYPIFFRHILPEDTLIAMNQGNERYSMSIFTYDPPKKQKIYRDVCDFLARALTHLYAVRPHWGKYNPLLYKEIEPLYPHLQQFREICTRHDPKGVFQNEYTKNVLGF